MAYYDYVLLSFLRYPLWESLNFHSWKLVKSDRMVTWALLDITVSSGTLFLSRPVERIPNITSHVFYRTTGPESLQDSEGTHDLSPRTCNLPDTDQLSMCVNPETVNTCWHHLFTFPASSSLQGRKQRAQLKERYRTEKFILHYPSKKTIAVNQCKMCNRIHVCLGSESPKWWFPLPLLRPAGAPRRTPASVCTIGKHSTHL